MIVDNPREPEAVREQPARLLLADVRQDMAGIFSAAGPSTASPIPRMIEVPLAAAIGPRAPMGRRRTALTPILAAATAGLLIGMAAMGSLHLTELRDRLVPMATSAPATSVTENPFEKSAGTSPAPLPTRPVTVATAGAKATPPTVEPTNAAESIMEAEKPAEAKAPTPIADKDEPADSAASDCAGDRLERAWCMRPDILEADRRLRLAYAEAIRQGVERRFLIQHQRRWTRLRTLAPRDPDGVLEGYADLAGALERLSVNGRAADRIR